MIITCKACSTNFNLDESLLKPEGIKVRCSVCQNTFKAFPPGDDLLATGLDLPDFDPDTSQKDPASSIPETPAPPVALPDGAPGEIIELELDEKSLGIDDIIDSLIFIPKDPDAVETEKQQKKRTEEENLEPEKFSKSAVDTSLFPLEKETGTGELTDLDIPDDDDFNLDGMLDASPDEAIHKEDIDTEFTPLDIDPPAKEHIEKTEEMDEDSAGDPEQPDDSESDGVPELESLETIDGEDASDELALEDSSDIEMLDLDFDDVESLDNDSQPLESASDDIDDDMDFDLDVGFEEDLSDEEESAIEGLTLNDTDETPAQEDAFDFGDDDAEPESDDFELEDDDLKLEEEVDNDTIAFAGDAFDFETDDTDGGLDFDSPGTVDDQQDDAFELTEDDGEIEMLDFQDDSVDAEDDDFKFDTEGELVLEDDEYDEEDGLVFEAVDDDFDVETLNLDEAPVEDNDDDGALELEDDGDEDEVTGIDMAFEDDDELVMDDGELVLDDEMGLDEEDDLLNIEDGDLEDISEDELPPPVPISSGDDQMDPETIDDIDGAFELEFDMDPDLGLADDSDPDYLTPEGLEEDDSDSGVIEIEDDDIEIDEDEDALEMLEIETEDNGEAFLEDLSESEDFSEYDDVMEQEDEPEIILESDETDAPMTQATIPAPTAEAIAPPPLTSRHFKKDKPRKIKKKGGAFSFIFKFLFLLVIIAAVLLAAYSYSVVTGDKIPYISDLEIPIVDQYLKKPEPAPAPVLVYPTDPSVNARFVANEKVGNLFVISGKVVNDSAIFVSHIKVQGTLVTKDKVKAKTKIAYCGNILTEAQLKTGDMAKIDSIISRKTGENNNNVKIKPHGMVQFMIVFSDLPDLLQNFEVKVAGFDRVAPKK